MTTKKITPFLWFEKEALDAARFYVKVFKRGKITNVTKFGGKVLTVAFTIEGQEFLALNGGPNYQLSPAFSLFVDCKDQREVDTLWKKLTANGGAESQCGWLVDRFGLSWQIIPRRLMELMQDPVPARAQAATQKMLTMQKIDVAALERAADGAAPKARPKGRKRAA
jgi:predicted 3-demethylubiquinone-9 3-methyltransferase (glyoxalase superfamily)